MTLKIPIAPASADLFPTRRKKKSNDYDSATNATTTSAGVAASLPSPAATGTRTRGDKKRSRSKLSTTDADADATKKAATTTTTTTSANQQPEDPPLTRGRRAITDNLGYRRLFLSDIVRLQKGDNFILILPIRGKRTSDAIKDIINRVLSAVIESKFRREPTGTKRDEKKVKAHQYLMRNNGWKRGQSSFLELECSVVAYPHHDDYEINSISENEVKAQIEQGAGISTTLLDYPSNGVVLRWSEIRHIQIFIPHYRGDYRPQYRFPITKIQWHVQSMPINGSWK
ncbi:hypothetical protein ACHAWU_000700 [Discostella pseudostelligera]|uniref:Uncharacterized protein n=1 Tax=Discostella pseudostelligera TaxID=259834 RepID=A0ABD3M9I7_9STRA